MATRVPHVKTRASVLVSDGSLRIDTFADRNSEGLTIPEVFKAEILQEPKIIDGVRGKEGELILSFGGDTVGWIDENGHLWIQPGVNDNPNRYSVDGPTGDLWYEYKRMAYAVSYKKGDYKHYNDTSTVEPENVLSAPGDVLDVIVNAAISGVAVLSALVDTLEGVTAARTVAKTFRVSTDGIFWSDWKELTDAALAEDSYRVERALHIQVRYTREGVDDGVDIVFRSLYITGNVQERSIVAPTVESSIFGSLMGSDEPFRIEENLFKKLYHRGIIPRYIERGDNFSYEEDEDYVILFSAIAKFFAYLIAFFKRFENIRGDYEMLLEQVRGLGLFFDEGNISLEDLQYLAQNYYSQIQQRGTALIFTRRGETLPDGSVAATDGELIRLLHSTVADELIIANVPYYKMGWCMRNSSPIYRGTCRVDKLNKTLEDTQDFQSLKNYPTVQEGKSALSIETIDGRSVVAVRNQNGVGVAGIGRAVGSEEAPVQKYLITADPNISYEIDFSFNIRSASNNSALTLNFGVEGFDASMNKLQDAFVDMTDSPSDGTFFAQGMQIWKRGTWYYVRGIIHAYSTAAALVPTTTNMGVGTNLIFNNPFMKYIMPRVLISSAAGATSVVDIWDYKVRPLAWGKSILPMKNGERGNSRSLGFIQAINFRYTFARNNNNGKSQQEITDIIEKYMYPYNKTDLFVLTGGL